MPLDKSDYLKIVAVVIAVIVTIGVVEYAYGYYIVAPRAIDEAYETAKTNLQNWWSREGIAAGVDRDQYYQMHNDLARSYGKPSPYPSPTSSSNDDIYKRLDDEQKRDALQACFKLDVTGTETNPQVTLTYTGELPDYLTNQQPPTQVYVNVRVGFAHSVNGTVEHYTELVQGWQHSWSISQEEIKEGVWVTLGDGTVTTELAVGEDDNSTLESTPSPSPTITPTPEPSGFEVTLLAQERQVEVTFFSSTNLTNVVIQFENETMQLQSFDIDGIVTRGWTETIPVPENATLPFNVVITYSWGSGSSRESYKVGG